MLLYLVVAYIWFLLCIIQKICFLVWAFNKFRFKIIISMYALLPFPNCLGFVLVGIFSSFLLLFNYFLMPILSYIWLFGTPWTAVHQASPLINNFRDLLKLMTIKSVMPSNHLFLCVVLFSHLQSFPASGSFLVESVLCIRWPKYWSFSFSPSNE